MITDNVAWMLVTVTVRLCLRLELIMPSYVNRTNSLVFKTTLFLIAALLFNIKGGKSYKKIFLYVVV